jgi:hypothetical protein
MTAKCKSILDVIHEAYFETASEGFGMRLGRLENGRGNHAGREILGSKQ